MLHPFSPLLPHMLLCFLLKSLNISPILILFEKQNTKLPVPSLVKNIPCDLT